MLKSIDTLEAGMEVAVDVLNVNNMLLIPKGTILGARQIRMLKNWGVEAVHIVDAGAPQPEAPVDIPSELLHQARSEVEKRFRFATANVEAVNMIRELAVKRTARRLFGIDDAALARQKVKG